MRKFTSDDVEAAHELHTDPLVSKYIVGEGEPSLENTRRLIEDRTLKDYDEYGYGRVAIIHKEDNKLIGFTGLKYEAEIDEVDVGYRLLSAYWNRGLAYEATKPTMDHGFNEIGLDRIVAGALPGNEGSIALMKKLGMSFEKMIDLDGNEYVLYAVSKDEYNKKFFQS